MDFFMPHDCSIDLTTPYRLLAAFISLTAASIALLVQLVMLWRRGTRARVRWWGRIPLVLPVLWVAICGLLASQAFDYYRAVTTPIVCPPYAICSFKGLCFPAELLLRETLVALLVAIIMLGVGWLALARFTRRINRA